MSDAPTRPVLRYYGGKWRLAPWIIAQFPAHRVYVEPFGGGASVLMRKPRSYAEVYNDLDGEIVNVFRVLRNPAQARELERLLRLTPYAREEQEEAYLVATAPIEQARRTIVKSAMGFGSDNIARSASFRANTTRTGTIPAHDWASFPEQIERFCGRLAGVVIENRMATDVMRAHDSPQTLHYVDPPYPLSTRGRGSEGRYRHELTDADHRELAAFRRPLKGTVIISGYPCELYDAELYKDWQRIDRKAHAADTTQRTEVLWASRPLFAAAQD